MTVNVYSNHNCPACMMTKRVMKAHRIKFNNYATKDHPDVIRYVKALGVTSAPIVIVKDSDRTKNFWYGFRPDKILALAKA